MRLETRLLEYIDEMAPPVTADDAIARRQSPNRSSSRSQTRRWGRMVPAWAYGLGALILVLVVALGVNLLLAGDQNEVVEPTPTTTPDFFTDIAPGEFVELPDWPLSERTSPPMVWTGAELIVWGDGIYGLAGDGAAFDLAKGTWRVIAEAPISPRSEPAVVWTGTEMIVLEGINGTNKGGAYNPATDTWRSIATPPGRSVTPYPQAVWTGTEAIVELAGDAAHSVPQLVQRPLPFARLDRDAVSAAEPIRDHHRFRRHRTRRIARERAPRRVSARFLPPSGIRAGWLRRAPLAPRRRRGRVGRRLSPT